MPSGDSTRAGRAAAVLALVLTAWTAGCAGERERTGETVRWDAAATADVAVTIGVLEGPEEYLFGDITSVAADREGRIYVADRIGSTIRVFGPDGDQLRWLGREGDGPGEYRWPADLTFGPDARLYVRDARRITVLAPVRPGAVPDSVAATWRIPSFPNLNSRRARTDSAGRYYYPHYRFPRDGAPRYFYLVYEGGEHRGDTIHVPSYPTLAATRGAHYMISERTGREVEGLGHAPFEPVPAWDVRRRGTVVGGDGTDGKLLETDAAGDSLGVFARLRGARRPVPAAERNDSARALEARIDSLPVPLSEVREVSDAVRDRELPDSLPAFRSLHVAEDDRIWVELWPSEGEADRRFFEVYGSDGGFDRAVVLPVPLADDLPPFFTEDAVFGVLRDPDTGIERVVKLPLPTSSS